MLKIKVLRERAEFVFLNNHQNNKDFTKFLQFRAKFHAVAQRCSVKKVVLEIPQNSQKNTCARASNKVAGLRPATLLKKRLWHSCFPVNFAKFLRTPFLQEHLQ